jgi:hypothetical protein
LWGTAFDSFEAFAAADVDLVVEAASVGALADLTFLSSLREVAGPYPERCRDGAGYPQDRPASLGLG